MRKTSLPLLGLAMALGLAALALQQGCIKRDLVAGEKPGPVGKAEPASPTAQADVVVMATPEPTRTVGDTFYSRGDFRHAIAYLREEVKKDPGNAHLWRHLGSAYGQFEDYNNAIYCYKRTLALNPTDLKTFYNLSLVYDFKGALPDAEQIATKGLVMNGKDAELPFKAANVFWRQKKYDDAVTWYRKALELKPAYIDAHFGLGLALKEKGDTAGAKDELKKACDGGVKQACKHLFQL